MQDCDFTHAGTTGLAWSRTLGPDVIKQKNLLTLKHLAGDE